MSSIEFDHASAQRAQAALPPAPGGLREKALEQFAAAGLPSTRLEDWKYTNLRDLGAGNLPLAEASSIDDATRDRLLDVGSGNALLFVNGVASGATTADASESAVCRALPDVLAEAPDSVAAAIAATAAIERSSLVTLNAAFLGTGAMIIVPDDTELTAPIHLVYATRVADAAVCHVRNLIRLGRNSRATVVEHYLGLDSGAYWTNAVTDIALDNGARLSHYKIQRESDQAHHTGDIAIAHANDSSYHSLSIALGARLCRNDIHARLGAAGSHCSFDGLYMVDGDQHVDHHTTVDHAAPHCTSEELYKGILGDRATGVFNGKVLVRNEGQRTDAQQLNKNLLLSDAATINTKPQLEIFADDVKCSHGATTGRLEEDAIFFLRARGIGEADARRLLTFAFANEIVGRVAEEDLRERLEAIVQERLEAMVGGAQ